MSKLIKHDTVTITKETRILVAEKISARFPRVEVDYIANCFERYPYAVFYHTKSEISGIFFYNFFHENKEGYFYFGPLFCLTLRAFAFGVSKAVRQVLRRYARVYFLAEVQNPELIIHLQTVFRPHIAPKPFTFAISDHDRAIVQKFQRQMVQLESINIMTFSSQCSSTLYYHNRQSNLMTTWLACNGISLEERQALVLLIDLTYGKFLVANLNIIFRYLTYPSHKRAYLKSINRLLRDKNGNHLTSPACRAEN